jgi:hypothetical protein
MRTRPSGGLKKRKSSPGFIEAIAEFFRSLGHTDIYYQYVTRKPKNVLGVVLAGYER